MGRPANLQSPNNLFTVFSIKETFEALLRLSSVEKKSTLDQKVSN
jgi:hypothetical protein